MRTTPIPVASCIILFLFSMIITQTLGSAVSASTGPAVWASDSKDDERDKDPQTKVIAVHCAQGDSINRALQRNGEKLFIRIHGTCRENVVIDRDDVTLAGADPDATIIGRVHIFGALRATLQDFTVRDTPPGDFFLDHAGDGIRVLSSTKLTLRNMKVQNTGGRGISIEDSTADVIDTTVLRSNGIGLIASASAINLFGTVVVKDGNVIGVCAAFGAHIFVQMESRFIVEGNQIGIASELNSVVTFANNSQVSVNSNLATGILVSSQGVLVYGDAKLEVKNNGRFGIVLTELANSFPFLGSRFEVEISGNGGPGIAVFGSSILVLRSFGSTFVIEGNAGPGLWVNSSELVMLGSTARNNAGPNVLLTFGARATFGGGNTVGGGAICDGSALIQGDVACGAPSATSSAQSSAISSYLEALESLRRDASLGL